ncbi:hypothetical protein VKT23_008229 [Stygiomarasmius scandens]|uniref:Uncharacterized protein n=1 Tax=Marasmiellus scandens TaxID=2682957 RepID=A0ABR1JKW4_9AGAR
MDTLISRTDLKEKLNSNSHSGGNNHNHDAFQLQPSVSQGVIRIHTQVQQETDVDASALDRKYAIEDHDIHEIESDGSYPPDGAFFRAGTKTLKLDSILK